MAVPFVGFVVGAVAIALGFVARREIRRSDEGGNDYATIGIGLGFGGLAFSAWIVFVFLHF